MPKSEKNSSKPTTPWESRHDDALNQAIIEKLMSSRSSFYHLPVLEEVNDHGGNRISQKIISICSKLGKNANLPARASSHGAKMKEGVNGGGRKRKSTTTGGGETKGKKVKKEEDIGGESL